MDSIVMVCYFHDYFRECMQDQKDMVLICSHSMRSAILKAVHLQFTPPENRSSQSPQVQESGRVVLQVLLL